MPKFSKKSLSLFLRNGCEKQFVFSLYNDKDRHRHSLPPRQQSRSALGLVGERGYEWQDEKVCELKDVFGEENVQVSANFIGKRPAEINLLELLTKNTVKPFQFIVEGNYHADTDTLRRSIGFNDFTDFFGDKVTIGDTQPDIIQVLPAVETGLYNSTQGRNPYLMAVLPNGTTKILENNDQRLRLRIIDIKLTSEPGAHYFAEVVYYSMTLAAWLCENNLDDKYVVIAAPAVWAGSHEASKLMKFVAQKRKKAEIPTAEEMCFVLENDLDIAPFENFVQPLRRILTEQLPKLLQKEWRNLEWYLDFRCKGCEYHGYSESEKDDKKDYDEHHCRPTAERENHLSQIFGLSRGATRYLKTQKIEDTNTLADTDAASPVFEDHQRLRAKRAIYPYRANALKNNITSIIPRSGSDALMPRFPNLHIYLFLDYDLSSAITAAIGVRAFWREPLPFGSPLEAQTKQWTRKQNQDEVFLVDAGELPREREEFLKLLRHLKKIIGEVLKLDDEAVKEGRRTNPANEKDKNANESTYQIYLWDEAQRKHLIRLVGRHLPQILADSELRDLAWFFPPPELLQHAEDATRKSPITIVSKVVNNTVAVPVAHHYSMLDVVKTYRPESIAEAPFVNWLYQEPMSDLLPAERIHEWWKRKDDWHDKQNIIRQTSQIKVLILNLITSRLESDLKDVLSRHSAPPVVRPQTKLGKMSPQSRLWLEFTRLNAALDSLDSHNIRSMPPHEREAVTKSARLQKRLTGEERANALEKLSRSLGEEIKDGENLFIYQLRKGSFEINARPGDINYALSPELKPGFLDESPYIYLKDSELKTKINRRNATFENLKWTDVGIEAVDRVNGFIALRGGFQCLINELERETIGLEAEKRLNFSTNIILDPTHGDYLTGKLKLTLEGIGYPTEAIPNVRTLESLGLPANYPLGDADSTPVSKILWKTESLYNSKTGRNLKEVKEELLSYLNDKQKNLDESQWQAWETALSQQFAMIWGPPGTGKSQTLRAIILGAVSEALVNKKPLRLLVTAYTNTAIDNVMEVEKALAEFLPADSYNICRIQRDEVSEKDDAQWEHLNVLELDKYNPSDEIKNLLEELNNPTKITIVGITPQQLHNLALAGVKKPKAAETIKNWFDFLVLDEVSQMDMATSTLVFSKAAENSSCVLAGDDLQLPPIQKAESPLDLENLVGSAYNYFRHYQNIEPVSLNVNYRSNETIVELTKLAGYSSNLRSHSPDLQINLLNEIPEEKPLDFPANLYWSENFGEFLTPERSVACFVYDDDISSQTNDFEAEAVASLIWLLQKNLSDTLLNEKKSDGTINKESSDKLYEETAFWEKAVGVVTPHRSQMSKIVGKLQSVFAHQDSEAIRRAVDTVERFQGQQRDVVIASFGLGDADIISAEDEFLYNLRRFNVLSSRPRTKLIVFITRTFLEHLSNDIEVLEESRFLKQFAELFCDKSKTMQLGFIKDGKEILRQGELRFR